MQKFLPMVVAQGVSDVHLRVGLPPCLRKNGEMVATKLPPMTNKSMMAFIKSLIPQRVLMKFRERTDFDFAFEIPNLARFRANLFYEMNHLGVVLRVIPLKIPQIDDLGLPTVIEKFCHMEKGLVVVTGPTGSGKSTTLAAMLNHINQTQAKHIVTLEDPVEYIYDSDKSVITQRQLGVDTDTYANGIKYSLRQDPDIILVGEMRDRDTIMNAIYAAETGHMVFATLHTIDAVQTLYRIINAFDPHEREPVRLQLASVIQGTISQRLIKKLSGEGRVAAGEVMVMSPAARDYMIRNEIDEIYKLMTESRTDDMCRLNVSIMRHLQAKMISVDDAIASSDNPLELQQMLRGAYHGTNY